MTEFVLKSIGLFNPTELERRSNGYTSRAVSQNMDIEQTINHWKKRFDDFGIYEKPQIVYAPKKLINSMSQRTIAINKSVEELYAERGVIFKKYIPTNREWLESLSNEQLTNFMLEGIPRIGNLFTDSNYGVTQWLKGKKEEVTE